MSFGNDIDFKRDMGELWPTALEKKWWLSRFLKQGDNELPINTNEVRNIIGHLARTAFDKKFADKNLCRYDYSDGVSGWWVPTGLIADNRVNFKWDASERRHMTGDVTVRDEKYKWHYGVSIKPWISRNPYVRLIPRVIFTVDGQTPVDDPKRMHRLRRSVPRSWRNERWRDLMLAFLFWFSGGNRKVHIETGSDCGITIDLPPVCMTCPISIHAEQSEQSEEANVEADDPVFEAEFEEEEESGNEA